MKYRKPPKYTSLETSWKGIFVTCNRGREQQCAREVNDWFQRVFEDEFSEVDEKLRTGAQTQSDDYDIEEAIAKEIEQIQSKKSKKIIVHSNLGIECVIFVQLRYSIDPVKFTEALCLQALNNKFTTKYVQRLAPVQQFVRCDEGLSEISKLRDLVQQQMRPSTRFAIRPNLRLCCTTRDKVIPAVAKLVGPGHSVSLTDFDQLIVVEGFKGVIGLAVFDQNAKSVSQFCRFNIAQIIALASKKDI